MGIKIEKPKYTLVTVNTVTGTTRKSRTYFINTAMIPNLPPINTMRELQLTQIADYVTVGNNLLKGDVVVGDTLRTHKTLTSAVSTQRLN